MDAQDFAILAILFEAPRASHDEVGRRVGLTGNAVRARLARLREDGVLQGFAAIPAPGVLGLQDGLLVFAGVEDSAEREEELLRSLADLPGVRSVDVSFEHSVSARVAFRDETDWDRIERAAISLVGKPPTLRFRDAPAPALPLAPQDLRILQALSADGRMGAKELTAATGMSFKTLRRRLDALLDQGVVRVEPVLSPAEARGGVLASAHLLLAEGATPTLVRAALPDGVVLSGAPGARLQLAHALRGSLREARAEASRLAALPGVEHVVPSLASRRQGVAWLADALQRAPPAPAPPPVPLARTRA